MKPRANTNTLGCTQELIKRTEEISFVQPVCQLIALHLLLKINGKIVQQEGETTTLWATRSFHDFWASFLFIIGLLWANHHSVGPSRKKKDCCGSRGDSRGLTSIVGHLGWQVCWPGPASIHRWIISDRSFTWILTFFLLFLPAVTKSATLKLEKRINESSGQKELVATHDIYTIDLIQLPHRECNFLDEIALATVVI